MLFLPIFRQGALKTSGGAMLGITALGLVLGAGKLNVDNMLYEGEWLDFDNMSELQAKRTAGRWIVYSLPYLGLGGDIAYRGLIENDLASVFEGPSMQLANDLFGMSKALYKPEYQVGFNTAKILGRISPSHWGVRLGHGTGLLEAVDVLNENLTVQSQQIGY